MNNVVYRSFLRAGSEQEIIWYQYLRNGRIIALIFPHFAANATP